MGLYPLDCPVDVCIAVWEWAPTSATKASRTASAPRSPRGGEIPNDALIPAAKATGQYLNSVLAKIESEKAGYEEGILLDSHGYVCEGTGENLFIVRDGIIATPGYEPRSSAASTALSAIQIARTSASRSWSATSRAASSTSPTRSS